MSLAPGSRLGPYEVKSPLGAGGMGEVFRARDTRLDRDVALKVLTASPLSDDMARARLLREARLASKLNHPNICTIYDVGESVDQSYIGMELVEGQSLSHRLADGPLPFEQVLLFGRQMADALAHAHGRGVVHRDFKSANVVVTPEGQVKVLDFGLAKSVPTEDLTEATKRLETTLLQPGMIAGTLGYMAPEQLRGEPADARSDVWALGVVLYEMTLGERPFRGYTGFEISSAVLSEALEPLPESMPLVLAEVISRCLNKEPRERYQSGAEVKAALEEAHEETIGATAHRLVRRRLTLSRRWVWATAALAMLVIIFGGLATLDPGDLSKWLPGEVEAPAPVVRLAVLPFATFGTDAEYEFLADGMTQELISQLGRLNPEALSVIGRTSVLRYKEGDKPIDQIGRELEVDYIVEGSVQREATRVRVAAELIHVADQAHVWADTYEQELSGILQIQSQLTRSVARALAVALLPAEEARLASARIVDPEAYEAYIKGFSLWQSLMPADFNASEKQFKLALERDPSFAPAHAGLAWVWGCRNQLGYAPRSEAIPKAEEAALQALALDENSAEAHFALACVKTWGKWDWPGAEEEWKRAIELNPNYALAQAYYAHFLAFRGRAEEGLRHSDISVQLDPLNSLYHGLRGMVLIYLNRYDEAMEAARTAIAIRSREGVAYGVIQRVQMIKGMREEQLADQRLRIGRDPERLKAFEKNLEQLGYEGAQRAIADVLAARYIEAEQNPALSLALRSRGQFFPASGVAVRYLDANDFEQAIAWLQKAYDEYDPNIPYVNMPPFDRLRDDPRYQALLNRVGIPVP